MSGRIALAFLLGAAVAAYSAGGDERSAFVDDLERRIRDRRAAGMSELSQRIEDLVRMNEVSDIRKFNAGAALAASGGKLKIASAAWWGWKSEDADYALNEALSAPVDILIVPAMSGPWIVGPLVLSGPKTVLFEPGCVVLAAKGAFREKGDCLLSIVGQSGITVSGYGARLQMRKGDYAKAPYATGQWRHAVSIRESGGILIEGLSIRNSGGDGVYIGQRRDRAAPADIVLRDLDLSGHHRQGVSVVAADGFLMEYCRITGTRGNPPQAGIDFEPNSGTYGLVDCRVSRCVFKKNAGAAVHVHLARRKEAGPPVSIRMEDSALIGAPLALWVRGLSRGAEGKVEFVDCVIKGLKSIEGSRAVPTVIR